MEIKHCAACGRDWCFRGTGRPLRCGKCKSPYWDKGSVDAVTGAAEKPKAARKVGVKAGPRVSQVQAHVDGPQGAQVGVGVVGSKACPECHYLNGCHAKNCKGGK